MADAENKAPAQPEGGTDAPAGAEPVVERPEGAAKPAPEQGARPAESKVPAGAEPAGAGESAVGRPEGTGEPVVGRPEGAAAFAAECPFDERAADVASGAVSFRLAVMVGVTAFLAGVAFALLFGFSEKDLVVGIVCLAVGLVAGPAVGCSVFFLSRRSARSLAQPGTRIGIRVEGERLCMYLTRGGAPISTVWREIASLYALERRRGYVVIYLAKQQANIVAEDAFTVGDAGGFCAFCAAFGVHVR